MSIKLLFISLALLPIFCAEASFDDYIASRKQSPFHVSIGIEASASNSNTQYVDSNAGSLLNQALSRPVIGLSYTLKDFSLLVSTTQLFSNSYTRPVRLGGNIYNIDITQERTSLSLAYRVNKRWAGLVSYSNILTSSASIFGNRGNNFQGVSIGVYYAITPLLGAYVTFMPTFANNNSTSTQILNFGISCLIY